MSTVTYLDIFKYFLYIGCTGFGGPLAVIQQMRNDFVKKNWVTESDFDQSFSLIKALPGPIAFQVAVYNAFKLKGFRGALMAAFLLITPAFLLIILFYNLTIHGSNSTIDSIIIAMQKVSLVLIFSSFMNFAQPIIKKSSSWLIFFISLSLFFSGYSEVAVLAAAIILFAVYWNFKKSTTLMSGYFSLSSSDTNDYTKLALVCLKAGAFIFGSGLAIIPILEADFVRDLGWMTHAEFLTALAMGQITPGPVVITVAHIGYKQLGLLGAAIATLCVFLPSFIHMTTWFPRLLKKLNTYHWIESLNFIILAIVVSSLFYSIFLLSKNYSPSILLTLFFLSLIQFRFKLSLFPTILMSVAVLYFV